MDKQSVSNNSDQIYLKDFISSLKNLRKYLLSKAVIIIGVGIVCAAIGLTAAFLKKPVYQATLSFALQDDKAGGGMMSGALGLASQFGFDLGGLGAGDEFSGDNLMELMRSRNVITKALLTTVMIEKKQQTLAEFYISFNEFRDRWEGKPELENIHFLPNADPSKFTLKQDSLIGLFHKSLLKENLVIDKVDKKLSILAVRVSSTNELFSKYFAEVLVKVVSDFYIQTKTKKSKRTVAVLQRQTDSVRAELNAAISGVASSVDATPNPNPLLQVLSVPSKRRQVDVQANTAILSEMVKNLEISKMSLMQATPLIQIIDTPILPLEKIKLGKLMGILIGGFLGCFAAIAFLISKRIIQKLG